VVPNLPLLYRALPRWIGKPPFSTAALMLAPGNLLEIPNGMCKPLEVNPNPEKYSGLFFEKPIRNEFKISNLDLSFRLGFGILSGKFLTLPRLGMVIFHHGDPSYYRGGPPAFWEVNECAKPYWDWSCNSSPKNGSRQRSCIPPSLRTDPLSVDRNANPIFWKSAFVSTSRDPSKIELIG